MVVTFFEIYLYFLRRKLDQIERNYEALTRLNWFIMIWIPFMALLNISHSAGYILKNLFFRCSIMSEDN